MSGFIMISCIFVYLMCVPAQMNAADNPIEKTLPSPECGKGWIMEEKAELFTNETLFDRINGESELYFPYGFEVLAFARYVNKERPGVAVEADVYRMGSLLDAFGIYANYRKANSKMVEIGAEGFVSLSQLLFYQDRYFVRLQATGILSLEQDIFLACALSISQNLPCPSGKPKELEVFRTPAVIKQTERYIAQGLLGYVFFRRGLIATAMLGKGQAQVFVVPEVSQDDARKAIDQYHLYLKTSGKDVNLYKAIDSISLTAEDPLYGGVYIQQTGRYLIGAIMISDVSPAKQIVEDMQKRLIGSLSPAIR